ncbi:hypothetical protein EV363DRAFT_1337216, partial [Boletus edulis]
MVVKLGVILLGMFNLALMLQGRQSLLLHLRSSSITKPRESTSRIDGTALLPFRGGSDILGVAADGGTGEYIYIIDALTL